jgi:chromosomal replication initiator protein
MPKKISKHYADKVQHIKEVVADVTGVSCYALVERKRTAEIVEARRIAMYLARQCGGLSYAQIGRLFRRDHSSVTTSVKYIAEKRQTNDRIDITIKQIEEIL